MPLPDELLLARCRAGDVEAFGHVYAQYQAMVFRHAYHLLGHEEDAHDTRQETFLRAWNALPQFRGDCSLKTWLLHICTNQCRNRQRTHSRRRETPYDPPMIERQVDGGSAADNTPHAVVEKTELAAAIRRALDSLPDKHRELIVLREIEELSIEEIARIVGCARASVPVKLFRARALLRTRMNALLREGE